MKRLMIVAVGVVGMLGACAGGSNEPCKTCPPVEGDWSLSYEPPLDTCPGATQPPANITITRVGSIVRSTIDGVPFTGTAYDTFEFTLRGSIVRGDGGFFDAGSDVDTAELRAKFLQGAGDGGIDRLRGSWRQSPSPGGCTEVRELNGTRP